MHSSQIKKAIFVHHAAGRSLFGIYELNKVTDKPEIKTVCKDKYLTTPVESITSEYRTHFEKLLLIKTFLPTRLY